MLVFALACGLESFPPPPMDTGAPATGGGESGLSEGDSGAASDSAGGDSGGAGDSGEGGEPVSEEPGRLAADPPSLDFGTLDVGDDASLAVSLENVGGVALSLGAINVSGSAFDLDGCASTGDVVDVGTSTSCTVRFEPSTDGSATGNLQIAWSDADGEGGTTVVGLEGVGEEPCTICTPLIDVDAGEGAYSMPTFYSVIGFDHTQSVYVENEGDEDLVISGVTIVNDGVFTDGTFSTTFTSATLGPYESTEIDVTYLATSTGTDLAYWELFGWDYNTLHVYSNDPEEPDYVISLEGIGLTE